MGKNRALGTVMFVLMVSAVFASTARQTGFLQDYHRLGHIGGVPLEQVWVLPEFDVREYRVLYIAPVQIDPRAYKCTDEADHQKAQRLSKAARNMLEQQLKGSGIFPIVTTDPYFSIPRRGQLTLETRITEINSGDPNKRVILGFGAGATTIQFEGKVCEQKTCRTLVEFADLRRHSGSAMFLGTHGAKDSEFLIGIDLKQILQGVVKLFIFLREEGPPAYQR